MDGFDSNFSPDRSWNLLGLFYFRKLGHFSSSLFLPRSKTGENFGCSWPRAKFFSPQSVRIDAVWGWEIIHEKIAKIFNLNLSSTLSERTCKSILLWIIPKRQTQVFSFNFFLRLITNMTHIIWVISWNFISQERHIQISI